MIFNLENFSINRFKEVMEILEFCDKCGSMMLPSKNDEINVLECILCKNKKPISKQIRESYKFHKEIDQEELSNSLGY